jgi:hypothetical protein
MQTDWVGLVAEIKRYFYLGWIATGNTSNAIVCSNDREAVACAEGFQNC